MTSHDGEPVALVVRRAGGVSAMAAALLRSAVEAVGVVAADGSKPAARKPGGWKIKGPRKPAPEGVMTRQRRRKLLRQAAKAARSDAKKAERLRRRSALGARRAAKS